MVQLCVVTTLVVIYTALYDTMYVGIFIILIVKWVPIVIVSPKVNFTSMSNVHKRNLTDQEIVQYSPEKEPTDKETGVFPPEEEPTYKETGVSPPKEEPAATDKNVIPELVVQEGAPSLPKREPIIDHDVSSSLPKKATDSLCPPQQKPPDKKGAPSSPEQKPPDKNKDRFSSEQESTDEELRSPSLQNKRLSGRRTIPFFTVLI